MGETETVGAAAPTVTQMAGKAPQKAKAKPGKKARKAEPKPSAIAHAMDQVSTIDVSASNLTFKLKAKKRKSASYALKGCNPPSASAAGALPSAAQIAKSKPMVELSEGADGALSVNMLSLHC